MNIVDKIEITNNYVSNIQVNPFIVILIIVVFVIIGIILWKKVKKR